MVAGRAAVRVGPSRTGSAARPPLAEITKSDSSQRGGHGGLALGHSSLSSSSSTSSSLALSLSLSLTPHPRPRLRLPHPTPSLRVPPCPACPRAAPSAPHSPARSPRPHLHLRFDLRKAPLVLSASRHSSPSTLPPPLPVLDPFDMSLDVLAGQADVISILGQSRNSPPSPRQVHTLTPLSPCTVL